MSTDGSQKQLLSANSLNKSTKITQDEQTAYFVKSDALGPKINSILYSMSLSTGEVRKIVQDSSEIGAPGISPDGSQILYSSIIFTPDLPSLYLLNTLTLQKRKIKEWTNNLYCSYPQFVPNSNQILFFEKVDSTSNNAYLRVMDLADTSNNQILDTVNSYYEFAYPTIDSKGDIFYAKNGITVLAITTNQKIIIPSTFRSDYDFISWSYDGAKLISTDNSNYQILVFNLNDGSTTQIKLGSKPVQADSYYPLKYPNLNSNNSKIFFTISFTETVWI
jgi:Tol biopolymer transport system component